VGLWSDDTRRSAKTQVALWDSVFLTPMPIIELSTPIQAPIDRVFDLARSIDAHMASTVGTDERAVAGRTAGLIEFGETVTWEARHLGIKQRLTVRITAFDRPVLFADEMVNGAFAAMSHTHQFSENSDGTLMKDKFCFTAPFGVLGGMVERLFLTRYMTQFLFRRGQALKNLAESDEWKRFLPTLAKEDQKTGTRILPGSDL
jgi:ligand-binding SRPBCC domain-containing protein